MQLVKEGWCGFPNISATKEEEEEAEGEDH